MQTDIPLLFACMLVVGAGVWWFMRMAGANVVEDDTDEFEPLQSFTAAEELRPGELVKLNADGTISRAFGKADERPIGVIDGRGLVSKTSFEATLEVVKDEQGRLVIVEED